MPIQVRNGSSLTKLLSDPGMYQYGTGTNDV